MHLSFQLDRPLSYRWTPFLNSAMSFRAALKHSVENKNNMHTTKNLRSTNNLFVPLWVAAATDGRQLWQRLEIDAVGGLQISGTRTLLTIYEMKSTEPGMWNICNLADIFLKHSNGRVLIVTATYLMI